MIRNILASTIRYRSHFIIRHIRHPWPCSLLLQAQAYSSTPFDNSSSLETSKSIPLPDLPPPVHGYPTFWINSREAKKYLYPLYSRGWGTKFYPRLIYKDPHHDRYVAHLTTDFTFSNYNCATQFVADFIPICEAEKHHPSSFTLRNNGKHPTVTLYVQTHAALRPHWNEEDPSADPPLSRRVPGITRRDLRFAFLVEQLYDTYLIDGRALERRGSVVKHYLDRPEWQHLVSRFIKSSLKMGPEVGASPLSQLTDILGAIELKHGNEARQSDQVERSLDGGVNGETEEPIVCHACRRPYMV